MPKKKYYLHSFSFLRCLC
ncbi:Anaerobic C4-dicarboxylate transporter DcuB, partial [Haemophilus influenzae]